MIIPTRGKTMVKKEEKKEVEEKKSEEEKKVEKKEGHKTKVATIQEFDKESWKPKTGLGKEVKAGKITDIENIFNEGKRIMEVEIIDCLFPNLESELLLTGQAKGKFGGGKRRVFKQTQKKTREGNKPKFSTIIVVGNKNGYVGIGKGKSKETVPAREKSLRNAKLGLFKIKRGSWKSGGGTPHTIPFKVEGKCGSAKIKLMPAPKGIGLVVEDECKKVLKLAGIKDAWSKTKGQTGTKINLIYACVDALKKITKIKTKPEYEKEYGIVEGEYKKE